MNEKQFIIVLDDTNLKNILPDSDEYVFVTSYLATEQALRHNKPRIVTNSLAHASFDLINDGYKLYVYTYAAGLVEFHPGMKNSHDKDIRFGHNIRKLIIAGAFDEDLKINRNIYKV